MKNPYAIGPILFSLQQPRFAFVREHVLTFGNKGGWHVRPCLKKYGIEGEWEVLSEDQDLLSLDFSQLAQILQVHGMYPALEPNQVFCLRSMAVMGDQVEIVGDVIEIVS